MVNEQGKLIRQAFVWKSEGVPNLEIILRLKSRGLKLFKQELNWILNNPFYCGIIVHRLLEGEVVEGKHPALISRDLFLKVNHAPLPDKRARHKKDFSSTPLNHFIRCADSGSPFAGYIRRKPLKTRILVFRYYKCPKAGCRCNKKAELLHDQFENLLKQYCMSSSLAEPVKYVLEQEYYRMNKENLETAGKVREQLREVEKKMETIEEKFVFNEINKCIYEKYMDRLREKRSGFLQKLREVDVEISNLSEYIDSR